MSGPKLIELRRMRAAAERQRNLDRCAGFEAEYARLLEEFARCEPQWRAVGIPAPERLRPLERVRADMETQLLQGFHHEAARLLGEETARTRAVLEEMRARLQERLVTLQHRHRQLARDADAIARARADLEVRLNTNLPEGWPGAEKERVRAGVQQILRAAAAPPVPGAPDNPEAIAALEKAEAAAALARAALQRAEQTFESDLKAAHARLLTASLASNTPAATPSLADVLRRFTPARAAAADAEESSILEVDRLLAALALFPGDSFLQSARARAAQLRAEADAARRRVLAESLLIDGAARLKELQQLHRWREEIRRLMDGMAHLNDPAVSALQAELRGLLDAETPGDLEAVRRSVQAAVAAAEARREREFKRRALLDSLKELGYETREGMETALVKEGRLVLQQQAGEEYALEVVANPELDQVQTALVRYADDEALTEQQRRRDREREESWCEDHGRLRQKMAERGFETNFKMQLKPGEHPVKIIVDHDAASAARARSAQAGTRQKSSP